MSLLPPEVHSALSQLLQGLQASENTTRSEAEAQLNGEWVQKRPEILLMGLSEQIRGSEDAAVRNLFSQLISRCTNGFYELDAIFCRRTLPSYSNEDA